MSCVYLDDILVTGKMEEHLQTLDTVLTRLEEAGLQLKEKKCSLINASVSRIPRPRFFFKDSALQKKRFEQS